MAMIRARAVLGGAGGCASSSFSHRIRPYDTGQPGVRGLFFLVPIIHINSTRPTSAYKRNGFRGSYRPRGIDCLYDIYRLDRIYRGCPSPGPPPIPARSTALVVLPDGQLARRDGHDGQPCGLTTCPHCGAALPTGVRPSGLTRFACLAPSALFQSSGIQGTCPRLAGGRERAAGKLHPARQACACQVGAARASWPSVGRSLSSLHGRRSHAGAWFTRSPRPSPGPGFRLSVALWRESAVVPSAINSASREG